MQNHENLWMWRVDIPKGSKITFEHKLKIIDEYFSKQFGIKEICK